jgi:hypothetical protein
MLSRSLQRLAQKAGLQTGNKVVRFHNLRKFLIDHLSSVMSESKWKQCVGKKISEGAYVSPDTLRADYARAMAETCFERSFEGDVKREAQKQALIMLAKMQGLTEDDLKVIFTRYDTEDARIEAIKARLKNGKGSAECKDGEHCQRIVAESELAELLVQHWRIVATLPSGKIVISNE